MKSILTVEYSKDGVELFLNSDIQSYGIINFRIKIYKLRFLTGAFEDRGIVILSNKIQSIIMCLYISKIKNQFATLSSIPIDM